MEAIFKEPEIEMTTDSGETYVVMTVDHERKLLYIDWSWKYDYGFDVIENAAMKSVEIIEEYGLQGAIANLKKVSGNWDPINPWIIDTWLPAVQEAGAKYWIHVQPEEFFAELSAEVLEEGFMMGGMKAQNAKTPEEALEWWDQNA